VQTTVLQYLSVLYTGEATIDIHDKCLSHRLCNRSFYHIMLCFQENCSKPRSKLQNSSTYHNEQHLVEQQLQHCSVITMI